MGRPRVGSGALKRGGPGRTLLSVNNDQDDGPLWARAQHDEGAAFAALFDRHRARVYRRALTLVDKHHDADDVTAAVFYELWRKRRSVTLVADSLLPWLLVTTVNLGRNNRRAAARYRALLARLPRQDEQVPQKDLEDIELTDRLRASLRGLSLGDAALLVLTSLEDVPVWQAAQSLGLKPSTARVRLHRIRQRLRVDLHDLNPSTSPAQEGVLS